MIRSDALMRHSVLRIERNGTRSAERRIPATLRGLLLSDFSTTNGLVPSHVHQNRLEAARADYAGSFTEVHMSVSSYMCSVRIAPGSRHSGVEPAQPREPLPNGFSNPKHTPATRSQTLTLVHFEPVDAGQKLNLACSSTIRPENALCAWPNSGLLVLPSVLIVVFTPVRLVLLNRL